MYEYAGRSILEILWEELDTVMDRLMDDGEPDMQLMLDHSQDIAAIEKAFKEWGEERGQAQGVAYAIAVMTTPYKVDVPAIKQAAMERWESRQD